MPLIGTRKFPKGPDLKRSEQHSISVSGTRIAFSAPAHRHDAIQATPPLSGSFNLYDASHFGRFNKKDQVEPASFTLELKDWRFNGIPLLDGTGVIGDMKFKVSIVSMPEFASLFHPRHLECAVERYIYTAYTAYRIPGECRQNWRVIKINGKEWVNYESMGYPGYRNAEECYESVWHTPITDQHLLTVRFDQVIRKKRTRLAEVYQKIIEQVMNSFEIQLSLDAQAQQELIRTTHPEEQLSETLPPYVFEEYEVDNEYDLIDEIGAQHNFELPHEEVKRLWEIEKKRQRQMQKETRVRVIESHLRFKLMEKE